MGSFIFWPLYLQLKDPLYPMDRRLGGPLQIYWTCSGNKYKNFANRELHSWHFKLPQTKLYDFNSKVLSRSVRLFYKTSLGDWPASWSMLPINILSSVFLPYLPTYPVHRHGEGYSCWMRKVALGLLLQPMEHTHTLTLSWPEIKVPFPFLSWYYEQQARCV
jgi:hypothetical protein